MKFSEVIGQEDTQARLLQLVRENRVPHAIMLYGPYGSDKLALALAFASYSPGGRNEEGQSVLSNDHAVTNAKAMLRNWKYPDLHLTFPVIRPTGVSSDHKMVSDDFGREWRTLLKEDAYFSMDQWLDYMKATTQQAQIFEAESDELTRKLSLKSSQGGYKILLIWLPECMDQVCANKLLKPLEEPPLQTLFILVCEEPEKLLEIIRSRVQRTDVRRIDDQAIKQVLVGKRGLEADTAHRITRTANGNWLKALETLDADSENRQFLETFRQLVRLAYMRNVKELKKWTEGVAGYRREKQRRMLDYFSRMVREDFMYNFRLPELNCMTMEEEDFAKNFTRFINEADVMEIEELFASARRDIRQNANTKIVFLNMVLEMIVLLIKK